MLRLLHYYVLCVLALNAQEPPSFGGLRFREFPRPLPCLAGINDLGEMVRGCPNEPRGYRIDPDGTETPLPVGGSPAGINNLGQIVLNQGSTIILLHRDGRTEERRGLAIGPVTAARAHALNNNSEIAGESNGKAVIWGTDGKLTFLKLPLRGDPLLGEPARIAALGINDAGMIVGRIEYAGPHSLFLLTPDGFFTSGLSNLNVRGKVANDGTIFAGYTRMNRPFSLILNERWSTLYRASLPPNLKVVSPNGQLFAGDSHIAERCATSVSPREVDLPLEGGTVRVAVSAEPDCEWTNADQSGSGSADVELTIAPSATPQTHHRFVAGKEIIIRQGGRVCEYSVPGTLLVPATGVTFSVSVTASEGCVWTPQSQVAWAMVDSPTSRTGSSNVSFTVEPNPTLTARWATFTLGRPIGFLMQEAGNCVYRVPAQIALPPGPGAVTVNVEAPSGCPWSMSSPAPWLIELPQQLNSAANTTNTQRTATITVAGQRVTVSQDTARPGEPYSVEPFDSSGPRQTFVSSSPNHRLTPD